MKIRPFKCGNLRLRSAEMSDADLILGWRNHPENRKWFWNTEEIDPERHQAWMQWWTAEEQRRALLLVAESSDGPVGHLTLNPMLDQTAELGHVLIGNPKARGRGYGMQMVLGAVSVAFRHLAHQVLLSVDSYNGAALRIYEAVGFKVVAERQRDGGRTDLHMRLQAPPARQWERWDDDGVSDAILDVWNNSGEAEHRASIAELVRTHRGGVDLLEVGCGSGNLARALIAAEAVQPAFYTGVDTSYRMLAHAVARTAWQGARPTYRYGDIFALPFSDSSVSTVLCAEVLGHLPEWRQPLAELCRVALRRVLVSVWLGAGERTEPHAFAGSAFIYRVMDRGEFIAEARKYGKVKEVKLRNTTGVVIDKE